jgi:hypothetical protein
MINVINPDKTNPIVFTGLGALGSKTAIILQTDYQKLQEHLEDCACAMRPCSALLIYVLSHKLMNTKPVSNVHCSDLVTGGCRVTYTVDDHAPQASKLAHRARAGLVSGAIPVASLLGATLIGMRIGQRAPLLDEDGKISRLAVIDVSYSA